MQAVAIGPVALAPAAVAQDLALPRAVIESFADCANCPEMAMLPSGLAMSRRHVTVGQFKIFARETGLQQTGWGCVWQDPKVPQDDEHPVVCVSYQDAKAYADWLSDRTKARYRLPTLGELRYALQAGEMGNYWWGQDVGEGRANCKSCKTPFDGKGTSPAGSFAASPYGLYDLPGNAWQWTSDCKDDACAERILAGGAWSSRPADLRPTATIWNDVTLRFNTYGIRVVKDVD
ncbi:SUMF1/EgtB/PvdO family nonheme iron enzyme [Chthonobacter rhizosphaerae]|uniref:SUMF1/EgtB/PvdO family nonheme iron enzyme n=1 Tax=Chthonobacter rhizosphaerae TaxID=2735553 RepID=UPI0015EEA1C0